MSSTPAGWQTQRAYDPFFNQLTPKTRNSLIRAGIRSLRQLVQAQERDLRRLRTIGPKSADEVRLLLAAARERAESNFEPALTEEEILRLRHYVESLGGEIKEYQRRQEIAALRATLEAEVEAGRVADDLTISRHSGSLPPPIKLKKLIELLAETGPEMVPERALILARSVVAELSLTTVDAEVMAVMARLRHRQQELLRLRFDISNPLTLKEVGDHHLHVTRERVRQLQAHALRKVGGFREPAKLIRTRSAIHFAAAIHRKAGLKGIERDLRARGLIESDSAFRDFLVLWNATALEQAFPPALADSALRGVTPSQIEIGRSIAPEARRMRRNSGAVSPAWLHSAADYRDLAAALSSLGYFEIAPDWFWKHLESKDAVETVARKVLSVAGRVSVEEIGRSLARHLGRGGFPLPPLAVLREILSRMSFLRLDGDDVVTVQRCDPEQELSGSELALYRYISDEGPVVPYRELPAVSHEAGFKTVTLTACLKKSPIFRKVVFGYYALVGSVTTSSDLEAAVIRARAGRRLLRSHAG